MPVGLGPVGLVGLYARRGEVQAAQAAAAAGVPFALSTLSACSIGEVARSGSAPFWFQLYIVKDRGFVRDMIARAKEAGCGALLLTVDLAVPGHALPRLSLGPVRIDARPGRPASRKYCGGPTGRGTSRVHGRPLTMGNLEPLLGSGAALADLMGWVGAQFRRERHLEGRRMGARRNGRDRWSSRASSIRTTRAKRLRSGADGIVVSNHGGRQLDGVAVERARAAAIADAIAGRMLSSGRRRRAFGARRGADARAWRRLRAAGPRLGLCARRGRVRRASRMC